MAAPDSRRGDGDAAEPGPDRRRRFVWVSLALFLALAVLHTWPLASAPGTLSRNDNLDTVRHEWGLAWLAHQVVHDPLHLFDANIFHPDPLALAYSDHLFIPGIFVAPLFWAGFSPVLVYNLLLMAGMALTGWVMSLVIHRWTGSQIAGLISGALVAFNAFTLTRFPQIQDQHLEFLPMALWALDRLLRVPSVRHALSLAGWFVLQALTSGYWLLFTTLAMVAGAAVRPGEWAARTRRSFVLYAALAGVVAGVVMLPFLVPYWTVSREQGLTRSLEEARMYSAHLTNYLSTGGRLHFDAWSHRFYAYGGDCLFPGAVALSLAAVAVGSGVALRDVRARMAPAFGVAAFALSFGPALPGYAVLYDVLPLMTGIRGVARFGQLWLVAIAILAGFGWVRLTHALMREPPCPRSERPLCRWVWRSWSAYTRKPCGCRSRSANTRGFRPRGTNCGAPATAPCWPSFRSIRRSRCSSTRATCSTRLGRSSRCSTATPGSRPGATGAMSRRCRRFPTGRPSTTFAGSASPTWSSKGIG